MRAVMIQPEMLPDFSQPYPFYIGPEGQVLQQDFWRGDPYHLIGFQENRNVQSVQLYARDFLTDPEKAVGMYPVFVEQDRGFYTFTIPVSEVGVVEVEEDV